MNNIEKINNFINNIPGINKDNKNQSNNTKVYYEIKEHVEKFMIENKNIKKNELISIIEMHIQNLANLEIKFNIIFPIITLALGLNISLNNSQWYNFVIILFTMFMLILIMRYLTNKFNDAEKLEIIYITAIKIIKELE
jgi:hypothetical protein